MSTANTWSARQTFSAGITGTLAGNADTATKLKTARKIGGVAFDGSADINLPGVNIAGNQNTTGNAATATKLQTARTINGVKFDGSANISIQTITSRGRVTALTSTTQGAITGLQMYEAYNNGYPSAYGNVLHLKGATAAGEGELFIGWSGTSGAHAPVHVRSRRDTDTASWSEWAQVYTSKDSIPGVNTTGNQNTTGNAASATKLQTARTIGGVSFNGTANIDLPGVNKTGNQSTTGNAATATKLQTARTIGGVSFDGTANINLPGVNIAGNQNTSGNAATATKLKTARKISGVAFDGSADITLKASHVGAFALGKTGDTVANDKAVEWNWSSGAYNATIGGASTLILHFNIGEGSCPAAQFRVNYKNGGIFYRSARDGYGFEADWSEFYTTTRKPTAGDVGALSLSGGQLNGALGIGTSSALGGNSIVLGDNDTGFKQNGDGNLDVYANNVHVMRFVSGSIQSNKTINITGRVNPSDYGNFDSRYVRDVRLGTRVVQTMQKGVMYERSGHVITGLGIIGEVDGDDPAVFRPIQKYINGTWYNVAQV